jgi:hypothetical protein
MLSSQQLKSLALFLQMNPAGRLTRKRFLTANFARKRAKARRRHQVGTPTSLI